MFFFFFAFTNTVALCVAQDPTTTATKPPETPQATTPSANTNPSEKPTQTEATPPSANTNPSEKPTQTEATPPSANTSQTEPTPTTNVTGTQKPPVDPTVSADDPGLSDGAIAGIAIGSIAGVAGVGEYNTSTPNT